MSTNDKEAVNVEKKTENDKPTEDAKCELKGIKRAAEEKNEDTKKPKRQENGGDNDVENDDHDAEDDDDEEEDDNDPEADEDDPADDDDDDAEDDEDDADDAVDGQDEEEDDQ